MKVKSNSSGKCPFCDSYNLEYGCVEFEDFDMAYFPWTCKNCKRQGEEWNKLQFIGHNVIDKNGNSIEIEDNMIEGVE